MDVDQGITKPLENLIKLMPKKRAKFEKYSQPMEKKHYRGSQISTILWTWKKSYYAKFIPE